MPVAIMKINIWLLLSFVNMLSCDNVNEKYSKELINKLSDDAVEINGKTRFFDSSQLFILCKDARVIKLTIGDINYVYQNYYKDKNNDFKTFAYKILNGKLFMDCNIPKKG